MSRQLSVTDFVRNFADFINRVAYQGEQLVLYRGKKALAEVRRAPVAVKGKNLKKLLESLPHLDDNDVSAFAKDLKKMRKETGKEKVRSVWGV